MKNYTLNEMKSLAGILQGDSQNDPIILMGEFLGNPLQMDKIYDDREQRDLHSKYTEFARELTSLVGDQSRTVEVLKYLKKIQREEPQ